MSYIPSHAMPHTYVHEDKEETPRERPNALVIAGAALLGFLLYKALR